jgi:ABC-type polysaccharide/polyol phosphate export permease
VEIGMNPVATTRHLLHGFVQFTKEVARSRRLIVDLTYRELRSRYLGSLFGLSWAFLNPAFTMATFFVVFKYGLKQGAVNGVPFFVWLLSGLVAWFFIQDCLNAGASSVIENSFLVKKVIFRVSLLPVVRLLGLLPVHLFFLGTLTLIFWGYGYRPDWYTLQVLYYTLAMGALAVGWSWLAASIAPFFRDLLQIIPVVLQILFYTTPIIWPADNLSIGWQHVLDINPLYYIVKGYRESLVTHVPFYHHPLTTIYFWAVTAGFVTVGGIVFLRLKPHFADVL